MATWQHWIGFNLFVLILLALDLGVLHRDRREIGVGESLRLSLGYFVLALLFAAGVFRFMGRAAGWEFLTGYLIEKSLSVDNIFVFLLIFGRLRVPPKARHAVLFWGVLGALVMRAGLVFAGSALLSAFHWMIYVFGGFLAATGLKMLFAAGREPDLAANGLTRFLRRHFPVTEDYVGERFLVRREGRLCITPLLIALALAEFSDAVFALDSIPAIFAVTRDPFLVYTSNVFAILGLRALFFALAGIVGRFRYLKYGLSALLVIVGLKMLVNGFFGPVIPTEAALLSTLGVLGGSIALSLLRPQAGPPAAGPFTGWIPGSPAEKKKTRGD